MTPRQILNGDKFGIPYRRTSRRDSWICGIVRNRGSASERVNGDQESREIKGQKRREREHLRNRGRRICVPIARGEPRPCRRAWELGRGASGPASYSRPNGPKPRDLDESGDAAESVQIRVPGPGFCDRDLFAKKKIMLLHHSGVII